ncbi:MAG TPA: shikimate kinase [Actinomycetales bacterium]|nr:shikimate kinase [Actinomycetales bacterium]
MAPRLVVVGPPGAGKTTVGRLVGERLGLDFVDTDEVVESRSGRTIPDIFLEDGEPTFRDFERAAVVDVLGAFEGVVALGGGAVMDPRTEADLSSHLVVFLDVGIADAAKRVGFGQHRPLLGINPRAQWTKLMQDRRAVYERIARLVVDTAGRDAAEVADDVVDRLRSVEAAS